MIRFALRLPEDLHAQLVAQAAFDRRSINSEILHLLETALTAVEATHRPDGDPSTGAALRGKQNSSAA